MALLPFNGSYNRIFYAYLSSDHVSPATGLTITPQCAKNTGGFGATSGTVTEIANGAYYIAYNSTDLNTAGDLAFYGTAATMDPVKFVDQVGPPAVNVTAFGYTGTITLSGLTTNIIGTLSTVTNLTNAPTAGDFTATMKTSITTAATAATPTAAAVTGAIGSISGVSFPTNFNLLAIDGSGFVTYNNAAPPSATTISGAVWDVVLASHLTPGSTGYALNAAGSSGDPWSTALPGAYAAGSAGYIVGNNMNASITGIPSALLGAPVDGAYTVANSLRLINSSTWGVISGAVSGQGGTALFKSASAPATTRLTMLYDVNGNRLSVTVNNDL